MIDRVKVKEVLEQLPDALSCKDIEAIWIELALERSNGRRNLAAKMLNVSETKIKNAINNYKLQTNLCSVGRPRKVM